MKLRLTITRPSGATSDVLVTADASTTVGDLAREIVASDAAIGSDALRGRGLDLIAGDGSRTHLDDSALLSDSTLASGSVVELGEARKRATRPTTPTARLVVLEGRDAGRTFPLPAEGTIGRAADSTVVLTDSRVSKRHAEFEVLDGKVRLRDHDSANGILVDGRQQFRLDLGDHGTFQLGETLLQVRVDAPARAPAAVEGAVPFTRSPIVQERFPRRELVAPSLPEEAEPPVFPWVALVAPIALGGLFLALGRSFESIAFFVASPFILFATFASSIWARRRRERRLRERFEQRITRLTATLESLRRREQEVRRAESPSTGDVLAEARRLGPLLWSRRPEHWQFLVLGLGTASVASRTRIRVPDEHTARPEVLDRVEALASEYADVAAVPVQESLHLAGAFGVAGPPTETAGVARSYLAQLVGLHSPSELVLAGVLGGEWRHEFDWLKWLPHVGSSWSPLPTLGLASTREDADAVLAAVEGLIAERGTARRPRGALSDDLAAERAGAEVGESASDGPPTPLPVVVLLLSSDAPADRARLVQIAERGPEAGVFTIWLAAEAGDLPSVARTFVEVDAPDHGTAAFVRLGREIADIRLEPITREVAREFARTIAPVVDSGAPLIDESDIPSEVGLLTVLHPGGELTADRIVERWRENNSLPADGTPRPAVRLQGRVGSTGRGAYLIDLRRDGPHALVGGTSGAGKSAFLQSWVLSMAMENSPARLTFLFVDYKGGATFRMFDGALPHSVGVVTDLDGHLAHRVLRSLLAEIHHREELFDRKKVSDLSQLEESGDPDAPPALVVVVDEYATLIDNVPGFEAGMVDIAQRGRALGVHLVLATQQPGTVVKGALRANANLRIALRVADPEDSLNLVGDRIASGFDPGLRGRAAVSTGPGRLEVFQAAFAGGTTEIDDASSISITGLGFDPDTQWRQTGSARSALDAGATSEDAPGSDAAAFIALLKEAVTAADIPARSDADRPWVEPLPDTLDLFDLAQEGDDHLALGLVDVPMERTRAPLGFEPERDQNLAVFGASGSGKSTALRSLAVSAARAGDLVDVYGLDFASGALGLIDDLPNVGAVVGGHDTPRVQRLLRMLHGVLEERRARYDSSTIEDVRRRRGAKEPRKLLLLDGYEAFAKLHDTGRPASPHATLHALMHAGRAYGIHVALTLDQPGGLRSLAPTVQKTIVLRQADIDGYARLRVPHDLLSAESVAGRAVVGGLEAQIAVPGGDADTLAQHDAIAGLLADPQLAGRKRPDPVGVLASVILRSTIEAPAGGRAVVAISDETLAPLSFDPTGLIVIAGPSGSGRSTALRTITEAALGVLPADTYRVFLSRSPSVPEWAEEWTIVARNDADAERELTELMPRLVAGSVDDPARVVLVVDGMTMLPAGSAFERALRFTIDRLRKVGGLVVVKDPGRVRSPLTDEVRSRATFAVVLSSAAEELGLFNATAPPGVAAILPPGRGFLVHARRTVLVQLPLPDDQVGGESPWTG